MKSHFYRQKWSNIKTQKSDALEIGQLARQIAHSFMDSFLSDCHYEEDHINLLCEMSTFSHDSGDNRIASQALFSTIIESLCDDFQELQTETYNQVMTQIVHDGHSQQE